MNLPQRITGLATEAAGDGLAVLDAERKQSYVLNATSALVFEHCDGQTSPEQLAEILRQKFDLRQAEAERLTELALEELETAQLLMTGAVHPATFSRRQTLTNFATLGLSLALLPLVPRVTEAQGGNVPVPLPDVLQCVSKLKIHHHKLDEFKRLAAECVELVRTKDTGTLQYEMYFNSSEAKCLVFERYRDSQALLDHVRNLGDTLAAISETFSGQVEICGTPSAELIEQLQGFSVQFWAPFLAA